MKFTRIAAGEYSAQRGPLVATIRKCDEFSAAPGQWHIFVTRTFLSADGEYTTAVEMDTLADTYREAKARVASAPASGTKSLITLRIA